MESQALIEPNSQPQAQAEAQAVPAVADSSKPTKSATEVDKSRVPGIVNRLIHKYPIGAISLPFILLIDTYLLFSPHSAAFNDLLDLFFIWLLWVSFVLAICGNLRLIWIFFTSGLQGITSFSETDFITIVGGCAAFSGELLVFVLLMTLVLYVLPSEVFYLGLWGIYFVGTVKAFRMPTGNQKEDDVEGGEANEGKDKSKRHLRLDRESWISLWTSGFIMWNSAMLFCMLQFPSSPDATPDASPTSEWRLKPPFNIQIPVPESVNNVLQGLLKRALILSFVGMCWAATLRSNMHLYRAKENEVEKLDTRLRIFLARALWVCPGVFVVMSIGMVWGVWLIGKGGV